MRALALLLLAPLTLAAQPVPRAACPLPRVVTAAPLAGQPADVAVTEVASLTVQPVTVQDSAGLRCLGYAERVAGGKKIRWRAWRTERDGFVRVVANTPDSAWSARADAVRAIVATRPAPPVVVEPTPAPVDPVPALARALLGAPTVSPAAAAALGPAFAAYDPAFATWAEYQWTQGGAGWEHNYYDRALVYYAMWARTGNPVYLERAHAHVVNYRDVYLVPATPPYGASAHWSQMRGLALHWALTGDERSRTAIVRNAAVLAEALPEYYTPEGSDVRILARFIDGTLLAWQVTANGTDNPPASLPRDWAARLDGLLRTAAAFERPADDPRGLYPVGVTCWTTMNYQVAMLMTSLIAVHDTYRADPALVAQVRRAADWLWTTQWRPGTVAGEGGFQYLSGACPNVGGTEVSGDLSGMFVATWGWLAKQTGDAKYRTQGDAIWRGMVAGWWLQGDKQFNETFSTSWRYLGWR